jgi:hypothetical protein
MFYIKVMNNDDMDYSMHSASEYRLRTSGAEATNVPSTPKNIERLLILDESIDVHPRMLNVSDNDVYIMNDDGKTIDRLHFASNGAVMPR